MDKKIVRAVSIVVAVAMVGSVIAGVIGMFLS